MDKWEWNDYREKVIKKMNNDTTNKENKGNTMMLMNNLKRIFQLFTGLHFWSELLKEKLVKYTNVIGLSFAGNLICTYHFFPVVWTSCFSPYSLITIGGHLWLTGVVWPAYGIFLIEPTEMHSNNTFLKQNWCLGNEVGGMSYFWKYNILKSLNVHERICTSFFVFFCLEQL